MFIQRHGLVLVMNCAVASTLRRNAERHHDPDVVPYYPAF
jgi:hypothetical protein